MFYFNSDYTEGAHPRILEYLVKTNLEQTTGYGEDGYCQRAAELIRTACNRPDAAVHFLVGGTQANLTVISAALRPHQGVLSATSGHINVHETGAIEATGHKVLALPSGADGKITAAQVVDACEAHKNDASFEHMVQPKMVYISHPTENGMIYTKSELEALRRTCDTYGLYLFLDGARLSYGLAARGTDVTLSCLGELCDVFYVGGTKTGALFGEAVVITNPLLKEDFRYMMKQKGAMLAKGRMLGLQFCALFKDTLYLDIAGEANRLAYEIADTCQTLGFPLLTPSPTNQQFPIFPNDLLEKLRENYVYTPWQPVDETHTAIRLCTSWATKQEQVDGLLQEIKALCTGG